MPHHQHPLLDLDPSWPDLREHPNSPNHTAHAEARLSASLAFLAIRTSPIYRLPAEILLHILSRLPLETYPALVAALWQLLRHHGVAPQLSTFRLKMILLWPRMGFYDSYAHATSLKLSEFPVHIRSNSKAKKATTNGSFEG